MKKTILVTGSTDGIGLETVRMLVSRGHRVLVHGRNPVKLKDVETSLASHPGEGTVEGFVADLSDTRAVEKLAQSVAQRHDRLDVLINNAGVYETPNPITKDGLDVRFVVNTIAPFLLTQRLMPLLGHEARVINLSSAAQSPVDIDALFGRTKLSAGQAYAQSKLAITMWSRALAEAHPNGPVFIAVNPASLLGSKMVKEAFGVAGGDLRVGAEILVRLSLDPEFASTSGQYFDNDKGSFGPPHPDALDSNKSQEVVRAIESVLERLSANPRG